MTTSTSEFTELYPKLVEHLKANVLDVLDYYFLLDPADGAGEIRVRQAKYTRSSNDRTTVDKQLKIRISCAFEADLPQDTDDSDEISSEENQEADATTTIKIERVGDRIAKEVLRFTDGICLDKSLTDIDVNYTYEKDQLNPTHSKDAWYSTATIEFILNFTENICPC